MSHHASSSTDYSINGSDFRVGSPAVLYSSDVDVDASFSDVGSGEENTALHSLLGRASRKKKKVPLDHGRGAFFIL
jgi:hypothetical protein